MKKVLTFLFVCFCLVAANGLEARTPLALTIRSGHPKLFADAGTFERIRGDASPLATAVREKVRAEAEAVLGEKPVERVLEGRRLLTVSRLAVSRLLNLSMAYRLSGDRRYLVRAKREFEAVCAFKDWNPSHFLDTAEAMFAVAVAYDWLYDELADAERAWIRATLIGKGLKAGHENSRWMTSGNNWNLVCHTGYLAAALALADEEPVLAREYVSAAVELMPNALRSYEGGNFPEGPAVYWGYATEYLSCALAMLESACGTTFGLDRSPGVPEQVRYLDSLTGPTGLFFNFSDAGAEPFARPRSFSVASFYLARHYGCPDSLAAYEMPALRRKLAAPYEGPTRRSYGRMLPLLLFWLPDGEPAAPANRPLSTYLGGGNPVASIRSGWNDPTAAFLAVKGGGPGHSHAHQDGGSFVFDRDGVRWFWDLGSENYHKLETAKVNLWNGGDGADRWRIARYSLAWHNTIMIDGCDQTTRGNGTFVGPTAHGFDSVTIDLSSLYTNATKVVRTTSLVKGALSVHDEIAARPGARVVWSGIVHGSPRAEGRTLRLSDRGKSLTVVGSADWRIEEISLPRRPYESVNPGFFRVTMSGTVPASGRIEFSIKEGCL